jgi:hypothetical protein
MTTANAVIKKKIVLIRNAKILKETHIGKNASSKN